MRDWIDKITKLNESEKPERKFYLREIEAPNGTWVWQHGMTRVNDPNAIGWFSGTFKSAKGAIAAAQRLHMNPNTSKGYTSEFFKNPIILDRLPLVRGNPFFQG